MWKLRPRQYRAFFFTGPSLKSLQERKVNLGQVRCIQDNLCQRRLIYAQIFHTYFFGRTSVKNNLYQCFESPASSCEISWCPLCQQLSLARVNISNIIQGVSDNVSVIAVIVSLMRGVTACVLSQFGNLRCGPRSFPRAREKGGVNIYGERSAYCAPRFAGSSQTGKSSRRERMI